MFCVITILTSKTPTSRLVLGLLFIDLFDTVVVSYYEAFGVALFVGYHAGFDRSSGYLGSVSTFR